MEDPRPRLMALDPGQPGPEEAVAPAPPRQPSRVSLTLLLLLVLAAGGLLAQSWRASRLAARVGSLEAELSHTHGQLQAREAHLERVRQAVASVQREVRSLESVVDEAPEAPTELP